ncbi:MAG: N-6 DNA methylase [Eubacteriales bacterium]|nr:N-6 DNA methylase [Eubacteriales bacterium]
MYNNLKFAIPQEKRDEINKKILALIDVGKAEENGVTREIIFNSYSGQGKLHGLSATDFDNFHAYSQEKKQFENGEFFTPPEVSQYLMDCIRPSMSDIIMDLCCGASVFANYVPCESNFYGNDISANHINVSKYLYPSGNFACGDIRGFDPEIKADIIVGNPPYNIKIGEWLSQMFYFVKASELLKPAGILAAVVPCSFLADEFMDQKMIREINDRFSFVGQVSLSPSAFKAAGVDHFKTKILFLQKKTDRLEAIPYNPAVIDLVSSDSFFNQYMRPVKEEAEKIRRELMIDLARGDKEYASFLYDVNKMLYQIKVHPGLAQKYPKCLAYYAKYQEQKKPDNMKYEEWQKVRITKAKVIRYLKNVLQNQNTVEKDVIRLVKTDYSLKLKAYSRKTKLQLSKTPGRKFISINDAVLEGGTPFEDPAYDKLMSRKRKAYNYMQKNIEGRPKNASLSEFLDAFEVLDQENDEIIKLNDVQKDDINRSLQASYGYLQWEQGGGKTLAGLSSALYRMRYQNARFTIVIGTAIAINNTWEPCLNNYGLNYIRINRISDLEKVKCHEEQFVLLTLDSVSKRKKHLAKLMRMNSQKVFVIIDEADSICNEDGKRSRATLTSFRRCRYKLMMSGTMNRNHIAESATAFEFLYNNSINMLSEAEYIYVKNKDGEDEEVYNEYYMCPIPAFKKGYRLFKQSHLPDKITVFGIEKHTQDIYNADVLKKLINRTVITRTFEEIVGKKIYALHQETVSMDQEELQLSNTIIHEFYKMKHLFSSTGNARKDRMLEIIQQLNLMLRACVIPEAFAEYSGGTSTKLMRVVSMLMLFEGERVAIGLRHIESVEHYAEFIKTLFPHRKVFIVTGKSMNLTARRNMVKDLKNTNDGILVSTQQSLSSSMNIGFVNKVILPELAWNESTMSQYYKRFIRFNSVDFKDVYYLTYENSIESNLLSLILAKEKLILFMKNQEIDDEEIYEKFGVHFDLLDMLLYKMRDQYGNVQIAWGKQMIV